MSLPPVCATNVVGEDYGCTKAVPPMHLNLACSWTDLSLRIALGFEELTDLYTHVAADIDVHVSATIQVRPL